VLRLVLLVHTAALTVWRWANFERQGLTVACLIVLCAWTFFVLWAYRSRTRRTSALLVADLTVAVAMLFSTPVLKGPDFNASFPGFWVVGALLAWAVQWRWPGGLAAAVVISAVDLGVRTHLAQHDFANVFLLLLAGAMVGYLTDSLVAMARAREEALRVAAVEQERTRLARAVHDGVLQVLALAQRRGGQPGGDSELGALAAEQEVRLRALIQSQDSLDHDAADADLAVALQAMAGPRVSVAVPGEPVVLDAGRTSEVVAAVGACLDNIRQHVGSEASAWILLEREADQVVVSIRDEGPGIAEGRLAEAASQGRLGVRQSIRGRIEDLGGTAEVTSGAWGTEWELVVPL
jgi:signal transduction histidine kinase